MGEDDMLCSIVDSMLLYVIESFLVFLNSSIFPHYFHMMEADAIWCVDNLSCDLEEDVRLRTRNDRIISCSFDDVNNGSKSKTLTGYDIHEMLQNDR